MPFKIKNQIKIYKKYGLKRKRAMRYSTQNPMLINFDLGKNCWGGGGGGAS